MFKIGTGMGMGRGDTFLDLGFACRLDEHTLILICISGTCASYTYDNTQSACSDSTSINGSLCPRLPGMQATPAKNTAVLGGMAPTMPDQIGVAESLEVMLEAGGPVPALLELAKKQAKLEEDNEAATKSPLLQALLQVSLSS